MSAFRANEDDFSKKLKAIKIEQELDGVKKHK